MHPVQHRMASCKMCDVHSDEDCRTIPPGSTLTGAQRHDACRHACTVLVCANCTSVHMAVQPSRMRVRQSASFPSHCSALALHIVTIEQERRHVHLQKYWSSATLSGSLRFPLHWDAGLMVLMVRHEWRCDGDDQITLSCKPWPRSVGPNSQAGAASVAHNAVEHGVAPCSRTG